MPQPSKIPLAFASSGDKNVIPENTETTGLASWRDGFPAITSMPFSEGGIAPKRADFNGIFNALSLATLWQQQGGFYEYDATTDYEVGNVVEYNNDLYKCRTANGPSSAVKAPTDTTVWDSIATASGYLPRSGGNVSGAITQTSVSTSTINYIDTTGRVTIGGGTVFNTGAFIWLYGKDHNTEPGYFDIDAQNGTAFHRLRGQPDGALLWGSGTNGYKNIAMREDGVLANMFFSQTSGSYTAPYNGVYRITLKGGGGGGGGAWSATKGCGGGGGEGGKITFYVQLTKGVSYPYVIGAGGAAAQSPASIATSRGETGGTTSFNGQYSISGGDGGATYQSGYVGGGGGESITAPSGAVVYCEPGQTGESGTASNGTNWTQYKASGGGKSRPFDSGAFGGGGNGAGGFNAGEGVAATNGGAGYILIEYAG